MQLLRFPNARPRLAESNAHWWFLALALTFGTAISLVLPAFQGTDEPNHVVRAWFVSNGDVRAQVRPDAEGRPAPGGMLEPCIVDYMNGRLEVVNSGGTVDYPDNFRRPSTCDEPAEWFANLGGSNYTPFVYMPHAQAFLVARVMGLSFPVSFYLARLSGLMFFVGTVALCIYLIPRGKVPLMVVALLPMSLQAAATINADAMTALAPIVVVTAVTRLAWGRGRSSYNLVALAVAAALCGLVKPQVIVFGLLALVVPSSVFADRGREVLYKAGVVMLPVVTVAAWQVVGMPSALKGQNPILDTSNPSEQVRFVVENPIDFLAVLYNTTYEHATQTPTLSSMVGQVGRVGRSDLWPWYPPVIYLLVALVLYVAATRRDLGYPRTDVSRVFRYGSTLVPLATAGLGALAMYLIAYAQWSPVGGPKVVDVQGRYLLPLLYAPPLAWSLKNHPALPRRSLGATLVGSAVLLVYIVARFATMYYVDPPPT